MIRVFLRTDGQLERSSRFIGIEGYGPFSILDFGFSILSVEPGFDLGSFFSFSPYPDGFALLQNHAVRENLGQGKVRLEGAGKEKRRKGKEGTDHRRLSSTRVYGLER